MSIFIAGATGQLGGLVIDELLFRGVAPDAIVAGGRNRERLAELGELGVSTAVIDHSDPDSLKGVFDEAEKLLLISGSEVGQRVDQHRNVIEAAQAAGVGFIAYTSILRGVGSSLALAADHQATERVLEESGVPFALLRHGWYLENYTSRIPDLLESGTLLGSAGDGSISAATRADYAAADAAVMAGPGYEGTVYELGGDNAFTLAEFAAVVTRASGREVVYRHLPLSQYVAALTSMGTPARFAEILADNDRGVSEGELYTESGDLSRLAGRPTTPLREAVEAAIPADHSK